MMVGQCTCTVYTMTIEVFVVLDEISMHSCSMDSRNKSPPTPPLSIRFDCTVVRCMNVGPVRQRSVQTSKVVKWCASKMSPILACIALNAADGLPGYPFGKSSQFNHSFLSINENFLFKLRNSSITTSNVKVIIVKSVLSPQYKNHTLS